MVSPLTLQLTTKPSHVFHVLLFLPLSYQACYTSPLRYPLRGPRFTVSQASCWFHVDDRFLSLLRSSFSVLTGPLWNQPEPLVIFLPRSASLQRASSGCCYCKSWYEIFQECSAWWPDCSTLVHLLFESFLTFSFACGILKFHYDAPFVLLPLTVPSIIFSSGSFIPSFPVPCFIFRSWHYSKTVPMLVTYHFYFFVQLPFPVPTGTRTCCSSSHHVHAHCTLSHFIPSIFILNNCIICLLC